MGVHIVLEMPIAMAYVCHQEVLLVLLFPAANDTSLQHVQLYEGLWEVHQQAANVLLVGQRCASEN